MKDQLPISAIVLTLDEEKNIRRCLESLRFVEEVLVLDSGSRDHTEKIATSFPNVRWVNVTWQGYAQTKQQGVARAANDWVLWIDADEEITSALAEEIRSAVNSNTGDVFRFPRKTFLVHKFIRHGGWYPDYQLRLFRRNMASFDQALVHENLIINKDARIGVFKHDLLHYSFHSLSQYFHKQLKYGQLGADELIRKGKKVSVLKMIFNPWWAFMQAYFIRLGFLEGKAGFIISVGSAYSKFIKYATVTFRAGSK